MTDEEQSSLMLEFLDQYPLGEVVNTVAWSEESGQPILVVGTYDEDALDKLPPKFKGIPISKSCIGVITPLKVVDRLKSLVKKESE